MSITRTERGLVVTLAPDRAGAATQAAIGAGLVLASLGLGAFLFPSFEGGRAIEPFSIVVIASYAILVGAIAGFCLLEAVAMSRPVEVVVDLERGLLHLPRFDRAFSSHARGVVTIPLDDVSVVNARQTSLKGRPRGRVYVHRAAGGSEPLPGYPHAPLSALERFAEELERALDEARAGRGLTRP